MKQRRIQLSKGKAVRTKSGKIGRISDVASDEYETVYELDTSQGKELRGRNSITERYSSRSLAGEESEKKFQYFDNPILTPQEKHKFGFEVQVSHPSAAE